MKHPIFKRVEELKDDVHLTWGLVNSSGNVKVQVHLFTAWNLSNGGKSIFAGEVLMSQRNELFDLLLEKLNELYPPTEEVNKEVVNTLKESANPKDFCPKCGRQNLEELPGDKMLCKECQVVGIEKSKVCPWCGSGYIHVDQIGRPVGSDKYYVFCDNEECFAQGPISNTKEEALERFIRGTK